MRKNLINVIEIVRSNNEKMKCNDYYMRAILATVQEVKDGMRQFCFHTKMDTNDVSDFFPLKNKESLSLFMDKGHPDWNARRHGFYHLLFTTLTKKKKKFAKAILHTIFSREFIANHRWPQPGFVQHNMYHYNVLVATEVMNIMYYSKMFITSVSEFSYEINQHYH